MSSPHELSPASSNRDPPNVRRPVQRRAFGGHDSGREVESTTVVISPVSTS
jgi:hypothetical protein